MGRHPLAKRKKTNNYVHEEYENREGADFVLDFSLYNSHVQCLRNARKRKAHWLNGHNDEQQVHFLCPMVERIYNAPELSLSERMILRNHLISEIEKIGIYDEVFRKRIQSLWTNIGQGSSGGGNPKPLPGRPNGIRRHGSCQISDSSKSEFGESINNKHKKMHTLRGPDGRFISKKCKIQSQVGTKMHPNVSENSNYIASLMKHCKPVLNVLLKQGSSWVFATPVDPVTLNIPDYFDVIKHPMDLGTIRDNLKNNKYSSPLEFASDVRLTFDNALKYNRYGDDVYVMAEDLCSLFEEKWKPIQEKIDSFQSSTECLQHNIPVGIKPETVKLKLEKSKQLLMPDLGYCSSKEPLENIPKPISGCQRQLYEDLLRSPQPGPVKAHKGKQNPKPVMTPKASISHKPKSDHLNATSIRNEGEPVLKPVRVRNPVKSETNAVERKPKLASANTQKEGPLFTSRRSKHDMTERDEHKPPIEENREKQPPRSTGELSTERRKPKSEYSKRAPKADGAKPDSICNIPNNQKKLTKDTQKCPNIPNNEKKLTQDTQKCPNVPNNEKKLTQDTQKLPMTLEEKLHLHKCCEQLGDTLPGELMDFIKQQNSCLTQAVEDYVVFDMDVMNPDSLWKLQEIVNRYLASKQNRNSSAVPPVSEVVAEDAERACHKGGSEQYGNCTVGNTEKEEDANDEEVDLLGSHSSPLNIRALFDTKTTSDAGQRSYSDQSSSSDSDSDSSSDSDSDSSSESSSTSESDSDNAHSSPHSDLR